MFFKYSNNILHCCDIFPLLGCQIGERERGREGGDETATTNVTEDNV